MNTKQIRDIFDTALNLAEDRFVRVPCTSRQEQDSIRAQLYRERANYLNKTKGLLKSISISRYTLNDKEHKKVGGNKYFVVLRQLNCNVVIDICDRNGNVKTTQNINTIQNEPDTGITQEQKRQIALMIADGTEKDAAYAFVLSTEE